MSMDQAVEETMAVGRYECPAVLVLYSHYSLLTILLYKSNLGKKYTMGIEGNNCRLRHRIRRIVRNTCCFQRNCYTTSKYLIWLFTTSTMALYDPAYFSGHHPLVYKWDNLGRTVDAEVGLPNGTNCTVLRYHSKR